ncbi:DUF2163 domain-containing protein [Nitratireductor soli]|uniref:DUF2163 domain-containing protein n=1 Tax=Nitratireductor soli TaxID=1670619 RepID=UPI00065E212D|nr:DUF2163 domain-containing protein [Nitratireductor soli]
MKTLPAGLQALLDSGVTTLCNCWRIARLDGQVFGFTDHDRPLTFAGTAFKPETGLSASEVSSSLGLAVDTMEVEGAVSSAEITEDDIALGLWDNAAVELWRVDWTDVDNRVILRKGSIGEVTRGDVAFMAELRGLAHALNQERGRKYQRPCDAVVGDARCTVDLDTAAFKGTGTVTTVSDDRLVTASGLSAFADEWFAQGVLTWTSGANDGTVTEVSGHLKQSGGLAGLTLWTRAARTIEPGDTFSVTAGCDKRFATCKAKFANQLNFRGFPHIPGNDFALGTAKRSGDNDGGSFFNG